MSAGQCNTKAGLGPASGADIYRAAERLRGRLEALYRASLVPNAPATSLRLQLEEALYEVAKLTDLAMRTR